MGAYPTATLELDAFDVGGTAQDDFIDHEVVRIHAWVAEAQGKIEHMNIFAEKEGNKRGKQI